MYIKFHLNPRKYFLIVRVVNHWNRFLREVVVSPSMEVFQTHLSKVLSNLV